jgi:hypothetical protein
MGTQMTTRYKFESEIEDVVRGFESCQTGKEQFPHRSHLTVAVCYLRESKFDQASEKMRTGLYRFLDHHGVGRQKYNETVTLFWMKMISRFMKALGPEPTLLEVANSVIESFADSRLVQKYYSPERLNSAEARMGWIEPDLREL